MSHKEGGVEDPIRSQPTLATLTEAQATCPKCGNAKHPLLVLVVDATAVLRPDENGGFTWDELFVDDQPDTSAELKGGRITLTCSECSTWWSP